MEGFNRGRGGDRQQWGVEAEGCGQDAFVATGFAEGFDRLEDQEAGYSAFAAFLVRVLDQMP